MPNADKFRIETRDDVESLILFFGGKPVSVCHSQDNKGRWEETDKWGVGGIVHYIFDKRRNTNTLFVADAIGKMDRSKVIREMSVWGKPNGLLAITYRRQHCNLRAS